MIQNRRMLEHHRTKGAQKRLAKSYLDGWLFAFVNGV